MLLTKTLLYSNEFALNLCIMANSMVIQTPPLGPFDHHVWIWQDDERKDENNIKIYRLVKISSDRLDDFHTEEKLTMKA